MSVKASLYYITNNFKTFIKCPNLSKMEPCRSNGAVSLPANNFHVQRREFLDNVIKTIDHTQEMMNLLSSELQACNELMIKQIIVSEKFSTFHGVWREMDFNQDVEGFLMYREIDAEVFRLSSVLDVFEEKSHKTSELLRGMTMVLATRLRELNEIHIKCVNVKTLDALLSLSIPDLKGIGDTPYPDLMELNQHWNEANIYSKLNGCIEALESLTIV